MTHKEIAERHAAHFIQLAESGDLDSMHQACAGLTILCEDYAFGPVPGGADIDADDVSDAHRVAHDAWRRVYLMRKEYYICRDALIGEGA